MPKFAANLTLLFTELVLPDRFAAAARAGFDAVEIQFPFAYPAQQIAELLHANNLRMVLHNLPAGNWDAGERGIACHPQRTGEFQDGIDQAIRYAKVLGVSQLNCLAGIVPPGVSAEQARAAFVANLQFAAERLKAEGIRLLIEAINTFDIPGFFLAHTAQSLEVIRATGSDNVFIQYDIYHMQRMEGELAATIEKYLPRIAHLQLADNPGRHEPGTGEINFPFLFDFLDRIGYQGWIGCEYMPAATTADGLGWLKHSRTALAAGRP